jgi:hypothetical protein
LALTFPKLGPALLHSRYSREIAFAALDVNPSPPKRPTDTHDLSLPAAPERELEAQLERAVGDYLKV